MRITDRGRIVIAIAFMLAATGFVGNIVSQPVDAPDRVCYDTITECANQAATLSDLP